VSAPRLVEAIDYAALPSGRHPLRYAVPSTTLPDGSALAIPVTVLVGRHPGSRVVAIAGVHGNEYPGPLALIDLARTLDPADLAGTLVLVPIANPLAFNAGTRVSPEDSVNLNRVFPGDPRGTLTARLAHALVHGIVGGADLAVDLHSAEATGVMLPMAGFRESTGPVAECSARAAAAMALEMDWMMSWAPGTLSTALNQLGIPAVGCELGGLGIAGDGEAERYRAAVLRLLDRPFEAELPREVELMEDVAAPASGLLEGVPGLRAAVRAGDVVGRVVDPWGRAVAELRAPSDGRVVHRRSFRQVRAGETIVSIGRRIPHPLR
jgi:predicted deacylase